MGLYLRQVEQKLARSADREFSRNTVCATPPRRLKIQCKYSCFVCLSQRNRPSMRKSICIDAAKRTLRYHLIVCRHKRSVATFSFLFFFLLRVIEYAREMSELKFGNVGDLGLFDTLMIFRITEPATLELHVDDILQRQIRQRKMPSIRSGHENYRQRGLPLPKCLRPARE